MARSVTTTQGKLTYSILVRDFVCENFFGKHFGGGLFCFVLKFPARGMGMATHGVDREFNAWACAFGESDEILKIWTQSLLWNSDCDQLNVCTYVCV